MRRRKRGAARLADEIKHLDPESMERVMRALMGSDKNAEPDGKKSENPGSNIPK